jgi:hypothetical protein
MNFSTGFKVCLSCCVLLFAAACKNSSLGGGTGTSPAQPNTAGTDPRGELIRAQNAMLAAKSYRARLVGSSSRGTNSTMLIEFVAPDRFHMTREDELSSQGSIKSETISLGQETYVKRGDDPWQKFPANVGGLMALFRDPKVIEELSRSAEVKFVGPDTLDGAPAMIYQSTFNAPEGKSYKTTTKTWIRVADNLPIKTESEGEMDVKGKPVSSKTTMTYYDYGADIKIERPM